MGPKGPIFSLWIVLLAWCIAIQAQAAAYTLTVTADHGSVQVFPEKAQYDEGEPVELIPRPESGYCFSHWSGDLRGKRLVGRVTMDSNKSITAHFQTWQPPIGIPMPEFGIFETYRMYDDPANRNPELTYRQNAEGGFYTHYIDNSDPNSTDTSNVYGSVAKPRKTIPNPVPAGAVVEVHGGPYGGMIRIAIQGTQAFPVFIRGTDTRPDFTSEVIIVGHYAIVEGIRVFGQGISVRVPAGFPYEDEYNDHIVIRRCELDGNMQNAQGIIQIWPPVTRQMVIYGNHIHHYGVYNYDGEYDRHGISTAVISLWVVDNHIHHNGGDSFQSGHGANQSVSHVYVGRNVMHDDGENAVDTKDITDVVVSENEMYSYPILNDSSDGVPVVIHYGASDPKTRGTLRGWLLANVIHDAGDAAVQVSNSDDEIYCMNNIVYDVPIAFKTWSHKNIGIINNTISGVASGVYSSVGTGTVRAIIANNIFGKRTTENGYDVYLEYTAYRDASILTNALFEDTPVTNKVSTNSITGCPNWVDPNHHDFHLGAESPAIHAGTADGVVDIVYDRFEELYGIDIRKDIAGRARPAGGGWDIGAYEYVLEPVGDLAVSGGSQNSLTLTWTIPGADGSSDRPGRYDIRYATSVITEATWDAATPVQGEPEPGDVGDSQSFTISGLNPGTTYYIGLKTSNTAGSTISDLSNIASATTGSSGNRAPVFQTIGDKAVAENATLTFTVGASDGDGDALTYSASGLPAGASFTPATRVFAWTPTNTQSGTYWVRFGVTDGQIPVTQTVAITVAEVVNHAPVLAAIGNKSANEGVLLSFSISATDSDGDGLTYSATGLPSGANFTGQTFTWVPTYEQAGSYSVTFTASDGELTDSEQITITVANVTPDLTAPVAAADYPSADAIQVPVNPVIGLTVSDAGRGVDANTVTIRVDDQLVYSGNTTTYQSVHGVCRRTGTQASYRYTYQPAALFRFDKQVQVRVTASDRAGNAMTPYVYSFTTEMRVFGDNHPASWAPDDADKTSPATVRDSAGNIWLAYHAGAVGQRDIYISKLTFGNANFAGPIQLTTHSSDQCFPAIAVDADDTLYVVWQDRRRGNWDIYVSTSSDGVTWSTETRITDSDDNQIRPVIAIDSQVPNRAHVAWQDDGAGNQDIYVASSDNGFTTKTVSQVTTNAADQTDPAVAVDASNTVYLVWADGRNGTSDLYGAASNNGPWTNVPVATGAGSQSAPAVAAEAAGTVLHFAWVDEAGGDANIRYASSNGLPGSPLAGTNIVDDTSGADQTAPAIVTAGSAGDDLRVFVCWVDERNLNANGRDTDLYFVDVSAGQGTNVLVGDGGTGSDQSEPAVGVDRYGYPYILWTDSRNVTKYVYYAGSTYMAPTPLASESVIALAGRTVGVATPTSADDVSVVIPANACPHDVTVTITRLLHPQSILSSNVLAFDFGPSGLHFNQPVTITIPYLAADYPGGTPVPCWYVSQTGTLSQQDITNVQALDLSDTLKALRFRTTHFTPYYLLESFVDGDGDGTWDGDGGSSDGGGGGGGGCSLSHASREGVIAFLLPYAVLAAYMILLRRRDRKRKCA